MTTHPPDPPKTLNALLKKSALGGETRALKANEKFCIKLAPALGVSQARRADADSAARSISRPGISADMLGRCGVRHVEADEAESLVGYLAAGLLIPYHRLDGSAIATPEGKPFYRLRLDAPTSRAKYLSPRNAGAQIYCPPGLLDIAKPGCELAIIEGEFKALALTEAGFPCIGIGGISSACRRTSADEFELLPDLAAAIEQINPARILFCGDNDTALIADFVREALKLASLVAVPVVLPRIPLDSEHKAADDLRDALGDQFPERWREIVAAAEPVSRDAKQASLALRLLRREQDALGRLEGDALDRARERLTKLGAHFRDDALTFDAIAEIAKAAGLSRQTFRAATKAIADKIADDAAAARTRELERLTAGSGPLLHFDGRAYWRRELAGDYGQLCREDARLHLGVIGYNLTCSDGEPSEADRMLHQIQRKHRVTYAGPLCGRTAGVYTENGQTVLATRSPRWLEPVRGDYPTIERIVANLFGRAAGDPLAATQAQVFIAWLKLARIAMQRPQDHRPGPVLALVGPPNCGKSLLQHLVITPSIGGRAADPGLWFTGKSSFNAELWAAEHLAIGDQGLGEDGRERAHLRDELKRVVASTEYPLHGKHRDALTLRPIWRISLSANDDPESAISLPSLDASFADKIIYLRCYAPPQPFFDPGAPTGREDFAAAIRHELPAFLWDVEAYEIPEGMTKGRFGQAEFHHPAILDLLENGSHLIPLAEVLQAWIGDWGIAESERTLTTVALYETLGDRLRGVVGSAIHLSRELGRLAATTAWKDMLKREDQRIKNKQRQTVWKFKRAAS